ncbi:penicillin-binding protein 1C [Isoalcanivorax pacificus W11-5]|uniref:peptidoglycan glycosyltransferase n=1 Tax=Isoalcanivorax pacificus W11-5 TaxID=391936 RepID=A0A0B4XL44_9GAMM|nr:penicillin-binding protein 1C [Isoalcanivorax pacificus]AJD47298.1 penicillin-binding protein 1C [Isoalcanivorax pacificus W11-5]
MAMFRPRKRHLLLLVAVALLCLLAWPLPSPLFGTPYAHALLDRDGRLLAATIAPDEQWRFSPVETAPPRFARALVTFEDKRFFWHPGVDPLAIVRATRDNLRHGRVVSGGSTLTMQLARQIAGHDARTLAAKLDEAWLALRLELHYSKEALLALYASHAPFGGNVVGLNAAAWRYFDRPPAELSWAEAAMLAVLPNNPALLHPGRNREALQAKRDRLLAALHAQGDMSDLDFRLALAEPLPSSPRPLPRLAPHLLATLQQQHGDGFFHTTLSRDLQQGVMQIAARHGQRLGREGISDLAVLVLDHRDGQVRAYVGNHAAGEVNREGGMLDLIQRPRSNGSLLKPFLYALMLQEGQLLPQTLVADIPTQFAGYSPENYDRDYRGAVSARAALARSLNVPMVRLLRQYGVERFHDQLTALGLTTLFRAPADYGLTLILGGSEATLWELTGLYMNLVISARDGIDARPRRPQWLLEETPAPLPPVIGQGAAWLTLQALTDVVRPGEDSVWREYASSQPIAWKTGTSFGLRDGWAIGSNGEYTVGVWAGNAEGQGVPGLTGTTAAAPVMLEVFSLLGVTPWLRTPHWALQDIAVCADDSLLPQGDCPTRVVKAPRDSHFEQVSSHYRRIHVDSAGYRVHAGCENPLRMQTRAQFLLPAAQEFFWRRHHPEYRPLPPWREDCLARLADFTDDHPIALLYPQDGTRVMLPVDLDGRLGRVMFRAVHRDPRARLQWHLDDTYLGETRHFHERALLLTPGWHQIVLIDQHGQRLAQWVKALARDDQAVNRPVDLNQH